MANQIHARFYEDDNASEASQTAVAAEDTNITRVITADNVICLRVAVYEPNLGGGD